MKTIVKALLFISIVVLSMQCESDDSSFVTIPDNNFLNALKTQGVDADGDGVISQEEAEGIAFLDVSSNSISDMTGIEAFVNLEVLNCGGNRLSMLDVSHNMALIELYSNDNQLTSLDLPNNTALFWLECNNNKLTSLDLSNSTALLELRCWNNQLNSLDISKNTALSAISLHNNQLTDLDVSNNIALNWLSVRNNQLTSLDISNSTDLTGLDLTLNQITSLDLSSNTFLVSLSLEYNQLSSLNISNNNDLQFIYLSDMPSLNEVCVWEVPFPPQGVEVEITNSPNLYFTTDCQGGD